MAVGGVERAELEVTLPSGEVEDVPMHASKNNQGYYEARVKAKMSGRYEFNVTMHAVVNGNHVLRTVLHHIDVVEPGILLSDHATMESVSGRLRIDVAVDNWQTQLDRPVRAMTQVWGTKGGDDVAVAWLGGIVQPTANGTLSFWLDPKWIPQGVSAPFSLRDVSVSDMAAYVPLSTRDTVNVRVSSSLRIALDSFAANKGEVEVTREMREGPRPVTFGQSKFDKGTLLLVHGYCVKETPYTVDDFTDYHVFEDFDQSRTIDGFANKVAETGNQFSSFGVIAHSMGGLASTHLSAMYHSNLDLGQGERLIQSLGTPYKGVPLAGVLAAIGKLVGIGCGANDDLTYDGVQRWAAGIPMEVRKNIWTYYTRYKSAGLVNYCVLAANAVLSWPNDGLVEVKNAPLDGAHDMGPIEGECHSVNMDWPPQCQNHERNQELNSRACR